jgi:hypothetical protein
MANLMRWDKSKSIPSYRVDGRFVSVPGKWVYIFDTNESAMAFCEKTMEEACVKNHEVIVADIESDNQNPYSNFTGD